MHISMVATMERIRTNVVKKSSGAVAAANFNVNNRQFNMDRNNADNQNSNNGVRGGVRVVLCCSGALRRLEPTPEHSSNFRKLALRLENLRFVGDMKLEQ